ncbi:MAG: tetratricopeptide repeat protein [Bacteroidetes bacterium]|nr:tetratricopeptide repeat protein [Bacteroidota bacterium]MBU1720171.1 tetratricopeptide repeat protein [Bacteroidota bacterium]
MRILITFLLGCSLLLSKAVEGQSNKPDSLLQLYNSVSSDSSRLDVLSQLFEYSMESGDAEKSAAYSYRLIAESDSLKITLNSSIYSRMGDILKFVGDFDSAILMGRKSVEVAAGEGDALGVTKGLGRLGYTYYNRGNYTFAATCMMQALKLAEKNQFEKEIPYIYCILGFIYRDYPDLERSKKYFTLSWNKALEQNNTPYVSTSISEIGNIYQLEGKSDSAIRYLQAALALRLKNGETISVGYSYNDIGNYYIVKKNYREALNYMKKSLDLCEKSGEKWGLPITYSNIGYAYQQLGELSQAKYYYDNAISRSKEMNTLSQIANSYLVISDFYSSQKEYKMAYELLSLHLSYRDSLMNSEKQQQIEELNTKYETEKIASRNEILEKDKALRDADLARKNTLTQALIGGLLLLGILFVVSIRGYRAKKRANTILRRQQGEILEKNEELQQQKEEIIAQRDEIEKHRDEVERQRLVAVNQRDEIKEQKKLVTDSIQYALRIQQAILPPKNMLSGMFSDSFIYYQPKDIVSGDFYWIENQHGKRYFAAVDCTGHGVPGAFMSIMATSLLNQAVNEKNISDPGEILDFINEQLNFTIRSRGEDISVKDGMDLSVCAIDNNQVLEAAGAFNSVYIIRSGKLFTVKGDIHPLGTPFEEEFNGYKTTAVQLEKDDAVYAFTDGYIDQMGGVKRKRFLTSRLREKLIAIHGLKMEEQYLILKNTITDWKSDNEQTDDILIMGIRV